MNFELAPVQTIGLFVAVVMSVTEAVKRAGLPKRFVPSFSILLGVAFGFVTGIGWLNGIVVGLTAGGVWSGTKATVGN